MRRPHSEIGRVSRACPASFVGGVFIAKRNGRTTPVGTSGLGADAVRRIADSCGAPSFAQTQTHRTPAGRLDVDIDIDFENSVQRLLCRRGLDLLASNSEA